MNRVFDKIGRSKIVARQQFTTITYFYSNKAAAKI